MYFRLCTDKLVSVSLQKTAYEVLHVVFQLVSAPTTFLFETLRLKEYF